MKSPQLFSLLDAFTPRDLESFLGFCSVQLPKKSNQLIILKKLIDLRKKKVKLATFDFDRKPLLKSIAPKTIANSLALLYKQAFLYLAAMQLQKEKYATEVLAIKYLNSINRFDLSKDLVKKQNEYLLEQEAIDIDASQALVQMQVEHMINFDPQNFKLPSKDIVLAIEKYQDALAFYLLMLVSELADRDRLHNTDYRHVIDRVWPIIDLLQDSPVKELFVHFYKLVAHDDIAAYEYLKGKIFGGVLDAKNGLHAFIINQVINKCVRLSTMKKLKNQDDVKAFTIYSLESSLYLDDRGKIHQGRFHNLLTRLCQFYSYDYLIAFVNKWLPKVETSYPESTKALSIAQVCFYKKKFDKIASLVYKTNFDIMDQKYFAMVLHLAATFHYRKKDYEVYVKSKQMLEHFLQRQKGEISAHLTTSGKNFSVFLNDLDQNALWPSFEDYLPLPYRLWCEELWDNAHK